MRTTESQENTTTELEKIAWLSAHKPEQKLMSLMHHFNVEALWACYDRLDGKKAIGADGISKHQYGEQLHLNLRQLINRMKKMAYQPQAVRQVLIPKEGKPGASRPLGISNFEDKLVQKRMQELLESIYDPIFLDCSYGFRAGRGCHDAVFALSDYLQRGTVEYIIDVDLANFFGTIDHKLLEEMLRKKIGDTRFLRYINRMFKAGVLAEGELLLSDEGVPQGSCCSPVLANIFAHYVIDEWFEEVVKKHCRGEAAMFRYADDLVICCNNQRDAIRIKAALGRRLEKYKLKLNEDKTKMVSFSRKKFILGEKQETFDFLGFSFYIGRTRKGAPTVKLKTNGKRSSAKLKKLNQWMRENRNQFPLKEIWKRICSKLRGHIQYYGVSHNYRSVQTFLSKAIRIIWKWLNRRSQKKSFNWCKFKSFMKKWPLPKARIVHRMF